MTIIQPKDSVSDPNLAATLSMGRWTEFVWRMIFQATCLLWERNRGFKHDVKYL